MSRSRLFSVSVCVFRCTFIRIHSELHPTHANPLLGLFRIISADFNKNALITQQFWQTAPVRIHQYLIEFFKTSKSCQSLHIEDASLACDQLLALIKLDYYNKALLGIKLPDDKTLNLHVQKAVSTFISLYQK